MAQTMLLEILKACGGFLLCMALWLAVQSFLRRRLELAPGADVLDDMTHGCGACGHSHGCGGQGNGACAHSEFTVLGRQS